MKRFYLILSICLFAFFLIPKINQTYTGILFLGMMIATIVGELIIPILLWYGLYWIGQKIDRIKNDPLIAYKMLLLVATISAFTSIGLVFPEYGILFN